LAHVHEDDASRFDVDREMSRIEFRRAAGRVTRRRMFTDLSQAERDELVKVALDAYAHRWGPRPRPGDLEAWIAAGMHRAMMDAYRERSMLPPPTRPGLATPLSSLLGEWLAADAGAGLVVEADLTDGFLRQLSPADARLLWLRCEGYTREEIADLLGIRPNAVSVRLHRLRVRLRETLDLMTDTTATHDAGEDAGHGAA
jgi:DNA-directed RNA polymerase specialized sigma24 family protein